ncbi:D-ornithine 4,5-aminomutase subunit OraE [Lentzea flava]|uniref:LuxR family transcriptional regulator n=1 Tax=Lentzea flava TaxID=103732 RepID=A0ABQ2VG16_9PSEU|nr:D-ornithine 4,5-aminomutase subunit OraE [Lentzea flava]MCP2204770.1 D-ornithine 4,5-aminomutase E subunit [Lentzea flava]GGU81475.1 LuxR family transcriptional regulator [Lentzea flava]
MTAAESTPDRLAQLRSMDLDQLRGLFWSLARRAVEPLAQYAAEHTTPSIERSILLRMGFDSTEAKELVDAAMRGGWLGDGVGGVLREYADRHGITVREAYSTLLGKEPRSVNTSSAAAPAVSLSPEQPLRVDAILCGLERYRPRRRGWSYRGQSDDGPAQFPYAQTGRSLKRSVPLQAAQYFADIDPQPDCVITAEIASGRFEDDLRRMRMAAWHGADHIMVIRTLGQSHYDGLLEGTPEGVGGVPITRKQLRASRRTLDLIEDEVGRPINLHSYVSGLAGAEMAVLFAEEGVNGAHQDCQYNILYRNINPVRSVVDAFEAKRVLADADILQVDGAHNANSTALKAWNIFPELMVQHALNCVMSECAGMRRDRIALSTVPPTAPPAPKIALDLPYAIALRYLFEGFAFRAQQNTRYSTTNGLETSVLHVLDTMISRLTGVDIQSTVAADEARHVPWHAASVAAVSATKQVLVGLDGLSGMVRFDEQVTGPRVRDLIARSVLMFEDILAIGGYFDALEAGFFVDSAMYPERNGDGIRRFRAGGVGVDTVVPRNPGYSAPVCSHFGRNTGPGKEGSRDEPTTRCRGCTLCDDSLVRYVDELDEDDNVTRRLARKHAEEQDVIRPEAEHQADGLVTVSMFVPLPASRADAAALKLAERMNLRDPRIVDRVVLHPGEGVQFELVGHTMAEVRQSELPPVRVASSAPTSPEAVRTSLSPLGIRVVGATLGNDEHSVGLQEITNIKHQGLEWFGVTCAVVGTSVPVEMLIEQAVQQEATAVLASLVVSHHDIHRVMMSKLNDMAVARGVRDRFLLIAGGPQVTDDLARQCGLDAGFGRRTRGVEVARFILDSVTTRQRVASSR